MINQRHEENPQAQTTAPRTQTDILKIHAAIAKGMQSPNYPKIAAKLHPILTTTATRYNALRSIIRQDIGREPPVFPVNISPEIIGNLEDISHTLEDSIRSEQLQLNMMMEQNELYSRFGPPYINYGLETIAAGIQINMKRADLSLIDQLFSMFNTIFTW